MERLVDLPIEALVWYVSLLDSLPDYVRAMIAGALLAAVLRLSQTGVPENDVQFGISFSKVSLIALVTVPLVVWLLPASRIVLFVEELEPAAQPLHLAWLGLLALWSLGFVVGAVRLVNGYLRAASDLRSPPPLAEDEELSKRLRHWQRRLGVTRPLPVALTASERPRHLPGVRRIVLPRAALHWPAAAQDLLIIRELCRNKKNHGRWFLFAQFVACCYWPLPWVRKLSTRLLDDLEVVADNLAEACYIDDVGYRRALRQLEQRLITPSAGRPDEAAAGGGRRRVGILVSTLQAFRKHLSALWSGVPWPDGDAGTLSSAYDRRRRVLWAEPGEKLVLLIGQAVLVAVIVGGATLRQLPPKVERDFSITLGDSWMKTFYRDQERMKRQAHLTPETYPDGSHQ